MQKMNRNIINTLDEYIYYFDKEWKDRCKPSSISAINKLKKYTKMDLFDLNFPDAFVEFVCFAGEDDGGLLSAINGKICISELVSLNQDMYENWEEDINPMEFEFMLDEIGIPYLINLNDSSKIWYENECAVSSSFENFLMQCAVRKYEKTRFKNQVSLSFKNFSPGNNEPEEIIFLKERLTDKLRLNIQSYSDEYFWFAKSSEISIYIRKNSYNKSLRYIGALFYEKECHLPNILDITKKVNCCNVEIKK